MVARRGAEARVARLRPASGNLGSFSQDVDQNVAHVGSVDMLTEQNKSQLHFYFLSPLAAHARYLRHSESAFSRARCFIIVANAPKSCTWINEALSSERLSLACCCSA